MTKSDAKLKLLLLKNECDHHPKAKSIKINKEIAVDICDCFLDLLDSVEFLSVSREFYKEDVVRMQTIQSQIFNELYPNAHGGMQFKEVIIKNLAHDFAEILPQYMDVGIIDDPYRSELVYKANLCVLKRKEF